MTELIELASDHVIDHIESLPDQPTQPTESRADVLEQFSEPIPTDGSDPANLLEQLFSDAIPHSVNTAHPGFLAYIPGGGLYHAAVADYIANAVNRYVGVAEMAPALVQIEATVIDWFTEMVGYPDASFGLLTSGGSMANLVAVITARRERLGEAFLDGVVYTSEQSHHSVRKAAVLAGVPADQIRPIATDDAYRIDLGALHAATERDRSEGLEPFLVVASAGTTNTGAVDDLEGLADLCEEESLWLHADGAYGGFFVLTDVGSDRLAGLSRCDSITLDPHKGLFLPYGTGALLVRDRNTLARTHAVEAEYLPDWDDSGGIVDFGQLGPELSRDFRGLRVWLPIKMHGIEVFRSALAEKLELARYAYEVITDIDEVTALGQPQLSTFAIRVAPGNRSDEAIDRLNREVLAEVNRQNRVHLSGTEIDGRFVIRLSVLSFRTHRDHIDACLADLEAAIATVLE